MKIKNFLSVLVMALALCVSVAGFVSCEALALGLASSSENYSSSGNYSSGNYSSGNSGSSGTTTQSSGGKTQYTAPQHTCPSGYCRGGDFGSHCCPSTHPYRAPGGKCFKTNSDANAKGYTMLSKCTKYF